MWDGGGRLEEGVWRRRDVGETEEGVWRRGYGGGSED